MNWEQSQIVSKTGAFIKERLEKEGTGHDWEHSYRVFQLATFIWEKEEQGDLFTIQLAAWLHDVKDWKFTSSGSSAEGADTARNWLLECQVDNSIAESIYQIVRDISYKYNIVGNKMVNIEGRIVQDADCLESMGAIGICRTMAYGGYKNRPIFDASLPPVDVKTPEQYVKSGLTSINHLFEKSLKLKDSLHTQTARDLAVSRHEFVEIFLRQFFTEWQLTDIR